MNCLAALERPPLACHGGASSKLPRGAVKTTEHETVGFGAVNEYMSLNLATGSSRRCAAMPPAEEEVEDQEMEAANETDASAELQNPSPATRASDDCGFDPSDRWKFLKQLPHKLVRDIGFVIASPAILMDSYELPTVGNAMLGGSSSSWSESAKWLAMLEVDQAKKWFEARKNNGRLGDHFASCVEYVLRFSPIVQAKRIMISRQVLHRVVRGPFQEVPMSADGSTQTCVSNSPDPDEKSQIASKVIVERLGGDMLIKFSGSVDQNASEEVIASAMPRSVHDLGETGMQAEGCGSISTSGNNSASQALTKVGKRKQKLLRKQQRLKEGKGLTVTVGEFDFLFQQENEMEQDSSSEGDVCLQRNLNFLKENVWKDRLETSEQVYMNIREHTEEINVHHWEVSVKFLLYAGPWEMFGLKTPSSATWKSENQDFQTGSPVVQLNLETTQGVDDCTMFTRTFQQAGLTCAMKDAWNTDEFLGCFLGPHIGETLYDRKVRLANQLLLSSNPHAASLLTRLFDLTSTYDERTQLGLHDHLPVTSRAVEMLKGTSDKNVCTSTKSSITAQSEQVQEVGIEESKVLRVSPRALLKGFLFYEYDLWYQMGLMGNIKHGCNRHPAQKKLLDHDWLIEHKNEDGTSLADKVPCFSKLCSNKTHCQPKNNLLKSRLNSEHWFGWWTRVSDFVKFACTPVHEHSGWYIVPKMEWLSPIVIGEENEVHSRQVLTVEEFLAMAAKVADEAEQTHIPRKQQFMVAEMLWEPEQHAQSYSFRCDFNKQQILSDRLDTCCRKWVEVSRGFVLEDTWPDSRLYKPHGYRLCWSSSLQGNEK